MNLFALIPFFCVSALASDFDMGYPQHVKLTQATVDAAVVDIQDLIATNTKDDGEKFLIPGLMQLAFHDCIDGCDACLDFEDENNAGLTSIKDLVETVYTNYVEKMSRADFWALAAAVAIEAGVEENNENICEGGSVEGCQMSDPMDMLSMYSYGRLDCEGGPQRKSSAEMPSALWGQQKVVDFFADRFGIGQANTVAVLGAHAAGKLRTFSTGQWTKEAGLSVQYYHDLLDNSLEWTQVMNENGKYEWVANNGLKALNVDMAMIKDIQIVDAATGESSCDYNTCSNASGTRGMFKSYSNDSAKWARHFKNQMNKVLKNGVTLKKPAN